MKLDSRTVAILQNYQSINPMILINAGNELRTISKSGTVLAKAKVENEFPVSFALHDLSRFLSVYSLFKDSDIEFEDNYLTIKSGRSVLKYVYCNPELVIAPPKKELQLPTFDIEFELKAEVFNSVMKAMQVLGYNEIAIIGDGEKLSVAAVCLKNKTSDVYSVDIGETDKNFNIIIEAEKLKILPMDYKVKLTTSKKGMAYLKNDLIEYWIAIHTSSKIDA